VKYGRAVRAIEMAAQLLHASQRQRRDAAWYYRRVWEHAARRASLGRSAAPPPMPVPPAGLIDDRNMRLVGEYARAVGTFVPRYLDGEIRVVWGDRDTVAPPDPAAQWRAAAGVGVRYVQGGHHCVEDDPAGVAAVMREVWSAGFEPSTITDSAA
jgi:hypothetical protein